MNGNHDFIISDGILTEYTGPGGDVVIPDGVTGIGWAAFAGHGKLTGVTIPGSVTRIRAYAFAGCCKLTRVVIRDGVARIGAAAFRDCAGLTRAIIPESVAAIGDNAFKGCPRLVIRAPAGSRAERYAGRTGIRASRPKPRKRDLRPDGPSRENRNQRIAVTAVAPSPAP